MKCRLITVAILALCLVLVTPALAQENPYRNAGEVTDLDIPVVLETEGMKSAGSSDVVFSGAGYTHKIGRVAITMDLPDVKRDGNATASGNLHRYSDSGMVVEHEVYRDLIKERVVLNAPATVRYSYDLALSDWVTIETDESRPVEARDANNTVIVTYPHTKQVTNYAKDSTIDISPDRWGNLFVYVNREDVVVMPKPFAIDAAGKRFEMDFELDKKAKTITVAGDLTGAKYPVTVDPTERVTNGGFETGNKSGWTSHYGNTNYYTVKSDSPFQGTYYLDVIGAGGYSVLRQTFVYNGPSIVSNAVAIPHYNRYDLPLSNVWYSYGNWDLNNPAQIPHGWLVRSTSASITGSSTLDIWTYSNTHGHLDSISVVDLEPPVADFVGTPLTGTAPLTVQFTDQSTNSPTSWSWTFGDGGTSALQNPSHQYTSAGTYTVSLTAANAAGSDGETKTGYVTVSAPQTTFTVYTEAVSDYHGTQLPLGSAVPLASTFYQNIVGSNNGGITWTGYGEYYNDNAGSKHWSTSEISSVKADDADFALFAGHGANDRIYFGTSNSVLELPRTDMQFGGSKAKWVTLSSCNILDETTHTNWNSVFNGLHILNSYETEGLLYDRQGGIYAAYLTGGFFEGEYYQVQPIRNAWRKTLEKTINHPDYFGASKWAESCGDDYLPGYGQFCSAPSTSIQYEKFDCDPETSD